MKKKYLSFFLNQNFFKYKLKIKLVVNKVKIKVTN